MPQDLQNQKKNIDKKIEEKNNFSREKGVLVESIIIKKSFSDTIKDFFSKKIKNNLELLETDLLKDEVEIKFNWRKNLIMLAIMFFVALIIVIESCILLAWWGSRKSFDNSYYLENEINYVKNELVNMTPRYNEAMDFNKRLNASANALNRHIYWTNFFSMLEKNTLKNVYYKNFSGDVKGKYILPAVSNDVLAISYQSKVFSANDKINSTSVSDENIQNIEEGKKTIIDFNFNLDLNTSIFN